MGYEIGSSLIQETAGQLFDTKLSSETMVIIANSTINMNNQIQ